jgi:N-acetylmuramoyl-L-alanine amidase
MAGIRYTVGQGECIATVARRFGVPWQRIWEHPENAGLKGLRGDPNVLARGDALFVPYPEDATQQVSAAAGAVHKFKAKLPDPEVRIRWNAGGVPRKGKAYVLQMDDGTQRRGTTDGDGCLVERIPATVSRATVRFESPDLGAEEWVLKLGHLDPVGEDRGVRQRLRNLGYHCDDGDAEELKAALALFQGEHGLEASGALDDGTRGKLREAHGS